MKFDHEKFFNAYKEQFATKLNQDHVDHRKFANAAAEWLGGGKLSQRGHRRESTRADFGYDRAAE